MPIGLFAQATCTLNGQPADCGTAGALSLVILIPLLIIGLLSFIGWLVMLIHAISHDVPNKAVWIVGMILVNVVWVAYYFVVKRPYDAAHKGVEAVSGQPPTDPLPPSDPTMTQPPQSPPTTM